MPGFLLSGKKIGMLRAITFSVTSVTLNQLEFHVDRIAVADRDGILLPAKLDLPVRPNGSTASKRRKFSIQGYRSRRV